MSTFMQDELPAMSPALRALQASLRPHRFDADDQVRPEIAAAIKQLTVLIAIAEEIEERLRGSDDKRPVQRGRPRPISGGGNIVHLCFDRHSGPDGNDGGRAA